MQKNNRATYLMQCGYGHSHCYLKSIIKPFETNYYGYLNPYGK